MRLHNNLGHTLGSCLQVPYFDEALVPKLYPAQNALQTFSLCNMTCSHTLYIFKVALCSEEGTILLPNYNEMDVNILALFSIYKNGSFEN